MVLADYLRRIMFNGVVNASHGTLSELQEHHLMNVPFENLDIHSKVKIEIHNSYNKIVNKNRGGFCYELNSAFYRLLKEIGFDVRIISARVYDGERGFGPEVDHMALVVTINSMNYLVDVGFGDFSLHPLPIVLDIEQQDPCGVFKIMKHDDNCKIVKRKDSTGEFTPEYIFSEKERTFDDFREMCEYHQTSPHSHFTQKTVCSMATKDGRITLKNNILKITQNGVSTERTLDKNEIREALWNYFRINAAFVR